VSRTLVTIATDGFRDYVSLPNGDTINLGTTSVLKLITEVVPFSADIRKALDTFLAKGTVTLAADQSALLKVLRPKKSRWAAHENRFIPVGIQDPNGVWNSMSTDLFSSKLASLETLVELGIDEDNTRVARQLVAALRVAAVDADAKRELSLFIENEGRLAAKKESILTNLLRKLKSDGYNHSQAPKLWMYLVDEGAKMYAKEMGSGIGDAKNLFPKELRESLAKDMADNELELMKNGEYDHLKKASSSVEAQVETVVGQVETALQVVETSPKANTHLAKKDLHIIATKLAAMVSEDAGPEVTAGLEDLAGKVAKIQSHFACGGGCSGHAQSEAESLLSKVEDTFQVVEASGKSGANLAKKDLHTTTVRLASLLREGGVDSVEGQKALRNLSFNVSKIRSHFASRVV